MKTQRATFVVLTSLVLCGLVLGQTKPDTKKAISPQATKGSKSKTDDSSPQKKGATKQSDDQAKASSAQSASNKKKGGLSAVPPWLRRGAPRPDLPVEPLENVKQLLKHYQIDHSALGYFHDGEKITLDDDDTIIRILYRAPSFRLDDVHRWTSDKIPWDDLLAHPENHRAEYYLLKGRVTLVEQHPLIKEVATLLRFSHYYRVHLRVPGIDHPILVCCRFIPRHWKVDQSMDEPVTVNGLFVKRGPKIDNQDQLVFLCRRIQWHPTKVPTASGLHDDHLRLAKLGMDVGLFDSVISEHGKAVGAPERECFYRLIDSIDNNRKLTTLNKKPKTLDLAKLLVNPAAFQGHSFYVHATLRRLTPIVVKDTDINARFGIKKYYQLDTFVSLGDRRIRLGKKEDKDAPVFENQFPVTLCMTQLPPALQEIANRQEESGGGDMMLNESIHVRGVFFKVWSYHTQFVDSTKSTNRQISPMLIAYDIQVEQSGLRGPLTGVTVGVVFLLILGGVWFYIWRNTRSDDAKLKELRTQRKESIDFE